MKAPELVRWVYFRLLGSYGRQWNFWARSHREAMRAIASSVPSAEVFDRGGEETASKIMPYIDADDKVLEVGCGMGRVIKYLAPHCSEIHGVDVSRRMVFLAARHLAGARNVFVHRANGFSLSMFADSSFDLGFAVYVLQHLEREHAVNYIAEMKRVIKSGGVLICEVPNLLFPRNLTAHLKTSQKSRYFSIARTRFYTPDEISGVVRGLGLNLVACTVDSEIFLVARKP